MPTPDFLPKLILKKNMRLLMNNDDLHWFPTTLTTNYQKKINNINKTEQDRTGWKIGQFFHVAELSRCRRHNFCHNFLIFRPNSTIFGMIDLYYILFDQHQSASSYLITFQRYRGWNPCPCPDADAGRDLNSPQQLKLNSWKERISLLRP